MRKFYTHLASLFALCAVSTTAVAQEKIVLLNEGQWQSDNGRVTYFENGRVVSNQWFRDVNGYKLGDTPNDIIQVRPNLLAIAVNWSNIIQFIDAEGRAVAAIEDVPNNRNLASDGRFVYVTSYGHECSTTSGTMKFTKGFVAKIDTESFSTVDAVEVGYEPDGIAYYDGFIFAANSGGYAAQENHAYEKTVSVIDASTMDVVRTVDTGQINLYGHMAQSGRYLCISSPGDYYEVMPATIIMDCDAVIAGKSDNECFVKLDKATTNKCVATDGSFYAVGSAYSYVTGGYEFNYLTIDPAVVMKSAGTSGVETSLPGTVEADIKAMTSPYGIYVNPYTGYIYATDAAGYVENGYLYQWDKSGKFIGKYGVYMNPSHILALNPSGESGINGIVGDGADDDADAPIYNLQGIRIQTPARGQIYIQNGKKKIQQ